MTPLEGLVMGSRSGDIDPGALDYYGTKTKTSLSDIVKTLNKESGLKGVCESNDMRKVQEMKEKGDEKVCCTSFAEKFNQTFNLGQISV